MTALKARRPVYGFRADLLLALLLAAWAEVETVWSDLSRILVGCLAFQPRQA